MGIPKDMIANPAIAIEPKAAGWVIPKGIGYILATSDINSVAVDGGRRFFVCDLKTRHGADGMHNPNKRPVAWA